MTEKPTINNKILVIAGTHQEYKDFINKHKLSPSQFPYVHRREHIMGQRSASYILVGRPWLNEVDDKCQELFRIYDIKEVKL